eukprot:GHUV01042982.1.p1 GENE.GHUV01042982.1~~GHUV01042982.1.p1  ORF type:complete len:137 (+),score=21.25 GHUV01042982.1:62-412(+)
MEHRSYKCCMTDHQQHAAAESSLAHTSRCTSVLALSIFTASTAARPRASLRRTMNSVAPRRASSLAVSRPKPALAPVMMHVLPVSDLMQLSHAQQTGRHRQHLHSMFSVVGGYLCC